MSRALLVVVALLIAGNVAAQERVAPLERLPAPAPAPPVTKDPERERLVGHWRGEAPGSDGTVVSWVTQRNADGSYRTDFVRTLGEDARESQIEVGVWGLAGGIYFTAVRAYLHADKLTPADTTDPDLYDAYRVGEISDEAFEYVDLRTNRKIRVVKVPKPPAAP